MLKTALGIGAICALGLIASHSQCTARGSSSNERPWAAEHVDNLPPDIPRAVAAREAAGGNKAAAGHYFSVSIVAGGLRFRSLHFEDFACSNRASVCNAHGCLHEVYLESGGRPSPQGAPALSDGSVASCVQNQSRFQSLDSHTAAF